MKTKISFTFLFLLITALFFQCNNSISKTVKLLPDDPFKNTIVPSQTFDIDSKLDNVIEGSNGTIIVCPKACFKNANGEIVDENVRIELSEALSLEEMLLSNLTTTSHGNQLETGGMIYLNATANGEQLTINKENPIYIEIPTNEKKAGMMAYKGIRNKHGNMDWIEPQELENFLITVDINSLDFLPQGFQNEVVKSMPFKNYKIATQELTDSLYYSFGIKALEIGLYENSTATNKNKPYYNKNKTIINEEYSSNSYDISNNDTMSTDSAMSDKSCGIDPLIIKVIKSDKYQNTFIATREFETRLKVIFKTCNNAVLETYINNLDKNLYEVDSLAAIVVGKSQYQQDFLNFSYQRLTKVKQADKYANILKGYYTKRLAKVKSEMEKQQAKVIKELKEKNEIAQEVAEKYKKLLWKREKFRMETYGFNWTETGWVNIDNGTLPKSWGPKETKRIVVENGKEFDRVYTYIIFTSLKSLYRLNSTDNVDFYAGNVDDKQMLMPNEGKAVLISIGYKEDTPSIAVKEFELSLPINYKLTLTTSTIEKVKETIKPYEKNTVENRISIDLEFMEKFYKEEQRQKEIKKEIELYWRLYKIVFPCCAD